MGSFQTQLTKGQPWPSQASHPPHRPQPAETSGGGRGAQTRPGLPAPALRQTRPLPRGFHRARSFPHSPRPLTPLLVGPGPGAGGLQRGRVSVSVEHRPHPLAEGYLEAEQRDVARACPAQVAGWTTGQQCLCFVSGPREGTVSPTRTRPVLSGLTQGTVRGQGLWPTGVCSQGTRRSLGAGAMQRPQGKQESMEQEKGGGRGVGSTQE